MSNNFLERFFQILAGIFIAVAAYFLWRENFDGVFVTSVLGCVSFFLSFRFQVKERLSQREAERLLEEERMDNYRGSLFQTDSGEPIDARLAGENPNALHAETDELKKEKQKISVR